MLIKIRATYLFISILEDKNNLFWISISSLHAMICRALDILEMNKIWGYVGENIVENMKIAK